MVCGERRACRARGDLEVEVDADHLGAAGRVGHLRQREPECARAPGAQPLCDPAGAVAERDGGGLDTGTGRRVDAAFAVERVRDGRRGDAGRGGDVADRGAGHRSGQ